MKTILTILYFSCTLGALAGARINSVPPPAPSGSAVETIVCIRHGEKPPGGLGQLTCRGLNRALALPGVLLGKYGAPQFVFAPSPLQKVDVKGNLHGAYYYVRPLITIEPTAIRCGLPVNTQFGYREIKGLEKELAKDQDPSATIFVAWEHALLDDFVRKVVADYGGNAKLVPPWPGKDYDTIFLLKITRSERRASIVFTIDHENLDGLSDNCPN